ncbi:PEP-CTERM sorting domain-containing protein [Ruficoccus sp. ZRK36]|uniref:PEP-CTERM sorting domain-containing protein n=1 Tax=Ruficoccus sp. ZRK36 TaxID=2866311 RepID=UPI001C738473|nr:PEP-CTERM sorting domain-containing protein [Ruficoccus sp. ZRK36]QYY36775.1 hypothetical protein K0V07_04685 [Ruficoccus sp. ZRK36]
MRFTQLLAPLRLPAALVTLGLLAPAISAHAAALAWDTFEDYTAGSSLNTQNGGTGWTSAWESSNATQVSSTSISYNSGGIVRGGGNSMVISTSSTDALVRDTFTSGQTGSDFYVSMIFQVNNPEMGDTDKVGAGYTDSGSFFVMGANNSSDTGISALSRGGMNGSEINSRVAGDTASTSNNTIYYSTTYFLVVKYGWDATANAYSTVETWLNPTTSTSSGTSVLNEAGAGGSNNIVGIKSRVFYVGMSGSDPVYDNTTTLAFDDIVFGDSFASVTGAIPEPATYAVFAGLAILGIAVLRRRYRS